jgi:hypothetical protein
MLAERTVAFYVALFGRNNDSAGITSIWNGLVCPNDVLLNFEWYSVCICDQISSAIVSVLDLDEKETCTNIEESVEV